MANRRNYTLDTIKPGLSYVVPVYNEENTLELTLKHLQVVLSKIGLDWEIIVVNDGSTDKTKEILRRLSNIRVINHPINVGYGNSLKTGINSAQYDWIGIIDADGTYPVDRIPDFVSEMKNGFDMVIGARVNMGKLDKPVKRMFRWVYRTILKLVVKSNIEDANSGFRMFNREMAVGLLPFLCGTFSFTTSLTILSIGNYFFVKQIPIQYHPRTGNSKVRHVQDSIRTLQYIVQGITFFNPIKFFMILSVCMIFVVCIPAMVFACFRMHTLSLYYVIFGAMVTILIALGALGDIVRISIIKAKENTFWR